MKARIVTNGCYFRIQYKFLWFWVYPFTFYNIYYPTQESAQKAIWQKSKIKGKYFPMRETNEK